MHPRDRSHQFARCATRVLRNRQDGRDDRRGAACVEFALVAPIFLMIVLGVSESSRLLDTKLQLAVAAREGVRLAGMDREDLIPTDQGTNAKISDDIRNFLSANGMNGALAEIDIVDPIDHQTTLDLDDEANQWELFELRVELPYSAVTTWYASIGGSPSMSVAVVFRNGRPQSA